MEPEEYEFLYKLEETFWWFVGMREITDSIVLRNFKPGANRRILDAGCGTGFNLAHFARVGSSTVFGLDLSAAALHNVRKRGFNTVCQASIDDIPFASDSFDLIVTFDVLCQVDDPAGQKSLEEIRRVLRPGGLVFIRVPAFEWMRSSHDDAVHSKRRFTRPGLTAQLEHAGLSTEFISYANCFLFPVVILRRMLKRFGIGQGSEVRPLPGALGWVDPLFRGILGTEAALFRRGTRLPFGLSVVCIARKPATEKPFDRIDNATGVAIGHRAVDRQA
jgi:SAM-dependent methyltransferase